MADVRMLVSWGPPAAPVRDRFSNTLYFSVDGGVGQDPDYQALANDLRAIYAGKFFCTGCKVEVRAYKMSDPKPRPERAYSTTTVTGTQSGGPAQVALCLSYFSGRNLPRQRGRIYLGPWPSPGPRPATTDQDYLIAMGQQFAGLGGVNVDWSVWSPKKESIGEDPSMSISTIWVDNSWDIIRSRKLAGTARKTLDINE